MATVTSKCKFPHDLNYAIKLLEEDIGARLIANQQLLKDAEATTEGLDDLLDEGNALLDELMSKNGAGTAASSSLKTAKDIADQYGLLPDKPTKEDEEKFVANADILLFDSIVYLSGDKSNNPLDAQNISTLRRLYFAVGKDLSKVESILNNSIKATNENKVMDAVFIHDRLLFKILPPIDGRGYTVEEVQNLLNMNEIEEQDIAYMSNFSTLVLSKGFLVQDQIKEKTLNSVPSYELITNVFHIKEAETNTHAMDRYRFLGYTGEELESIILGQDYIDNYALTITNKVDALHAEAARLISLIDLILSRPANSMTTFEYNNFFDSLVAGLKNLSNQHKALISLLKFEVSQFLQQDILIQLRKKHTDAQIKYLLERRKDILGIYFNPPDDVYLENLTRSLDAALPNTTYISNQAINKPDPSKYDQKSVLTMYAYLLDALNYTYNRNNESLRLIRTSLFSYMGMTPIIEPVPVETYQGQPSTASPSEILTDKFDVFKSMDFEERKKDVKDAFKDLYDIYPASIAGPLSDVINSVTDLFEKVFKAVDVIISQAEKTLLALKKRFDAWLSKQASLTGQGDFSSSLLKCSINWDIGVSADILDNLFNFLMKILAQFLAFLSKLKAWIYDMITKIICLPVNLLNAFLGKIQMALPSACKIPKFDLGTKLNASLDRLLAVSTAKQVVLNAFNKDIAKVRLSVSAAPDRLGQFKSSAHCESSASSNFMNASTLNVGAGVSL